MNSDTRYGELVRVDRTTGEVTEILKRIPLGWRAAEGGVDEATLQEVLFDHPECLPVAAIDSAYGDPVPVCRELSVPAGSIDALYVNVLGRLTLCEFKLWRNPQARREVIGQILDYATAPEPLSNQERENRRFWRAVFRDHSFADSTVEVPEPRRMANVNVKVKNSGFGGWGLSFVAHLYRSQPTLGCYLTCRKDQRREERIFDEVIASLEDVQRKIRPPASNRPGDWRDMELWKSGSGRPRLGFRAQRDLSFLAGSEESEPYRDAVAWMRHRLNLLVSVLNPRLQQMLADD